MKKIEQTLKNYPLTTTVGTLILLAFSIMSATWAVSNLISSYENRITGLEEFTYDGSRYTTNEAASDFRLRDQRLDQLDKQFENIDDKLDIILEIID